MRRIYFSKFLLSALLASNAFAAFDDLRDLNARGVALGGAVLTLGNDGNALAGNPALLTVKPAASLGLTSHLTGTGLENDSLFSANLSGTLPLDGLGGIGASLVTELNTVTVGGAAKLLYGDYRASAGFGLLTPFKWLQFGGVLHAHAVSLDPDLAPLGYIYPLEMNGTVGIFASPIQFVGIGLAWSYFLSGLDGKTVRSDNSQSSAIRLGIGTRNPILLGEAALEYLPMESRFAFALGVERFFLKNVLRFSAGVRFAGLSGDFTPSAGIGLRLGKITFDYTFTYPVSGALKYGTHWLTIGI